MNDKPNKQHEQRLIVVLVLLLLALCAANLWFGSVQIPASAVWDILCGKEPEKEVWKFIVLESRLPQMAAALLSGAALAIAGLLLQTAFNNPLAGPSILGIDTGASLGVALVMLFWGGTLGVSEATTLTGFTAIIAGAFLGSVTVLGTILFFSTIVKNNIMLLIVGIMVGYLSTQLFRNSRRGTLLYDLGYGKFQRSHRRAAALFRTFRICRTYHRNTSDKTTQCLAAR